MFLATPARRAPLRAGAALPSARARPYPARPVDMTMR